MYILLLKYIRCCLQNNSRQTKDNIKKTNRETNQHTHK